VQVLRVLVDRCPEALAAATDRGRCTAPSPTERRGTWCNSSRKGARVRSRKRCQRGDGSRCIWPSPRQPRWWRWSRALWTRLRGPSRPRTTLGHQRCTLRPGAARRPRWSGSSSTDALRPSRNVTTGGIFRCTSRPATGHCCRWSNSSSSDAPMPSSKEMPKVVYLSTSLPPPPPTRHWMGVRFLVDRCPHSLEARDQGGNLPLHVATSRRGASLPLVKLLVDRFPGALLDETAHGGLPWHLAEAKRRAPGGGPVPCGQEPARPRRAGRGGAPRCRRPGGCGTDATPRTREASRIIRSLEIVEFAVRTVCRLC
jgi:hypothetical protein